MIILEDHCKDTGVTINAMHPGNVKTETGAVLERAKGRDYYDFIFLSGLTEPDFGYLDMKFGIKDHVQLYKRILDSCESIDFEMKSRDFEKLVFDQAETKKVLLFKEYIRQKYDETMR